LGTSSADEFLDAALSWFGDPDTRFGTMWEKGERLAKLIEHPRTLLVLESSTLYYSEIKTRDCALGS
jgi:hypothetical protein